MVEQKETSQLYIHVVSPVHVGGGQEKYWIQGVNYLYDQQQNIVRVFDLDKLGNYLSEREINQYTNSIEKGRSADFFDYLTNVRKIPFSKFSKEFYMPFRPEGEIKTMIRTGLGVPYIPGSSIKGAIRSAVFGWAYANVNGFKLKIDNLNISNPPRGYGNKLDEALFGKIDNSLMRFLQVSDALFENTMLFNSKVFNLYEDRGSQEWFGGWKHAQREGTDENFSPSGFSTTYETLEMDDCARVKIKINKSIWDLMGKYPDIKRPEYGRMLMKENPLESLFEMVNFSTGKYIRDEIAFFRAFPTENSDHITDELEEILELIDDDNKSCVLKLGAGTGFHAITGNWQYGDFTKTGIHYGGRFNGKKKYKSRKVSFTKFDTDEGLSTLLYPMGFVKIYTQEAWDKV